MIRFIAVMDNKKGIADKHGIPWQGKLPTDIKAFRDKTRHSIVLMGYGTYLEFDKPLSDRRNYVATRKPETLRAGFEAVKDAREFLKKFQQNFQYTRLTNLDAGQGAGEKRTESYQEYGEGVSEPATQASAKSTSRVTSSARQQAGAVREPDVWVIGGAGLFASVLDMADELDLTRVAEDFHCTKFFPEFETQFKRISHGKPQTENGITFHFELWTRK